MSWWFVPAPFHHLLSWCSRCRVAQYLAMPSNMVYIAIYIVHGKSMGLVLCSHYAHWSITWAVYVNTLLAACVLNISSTLRSLDWLYSLDFSLNSRKSLRALAEQDIELPPVPFSLFQDVNPPLSHIHWNYICHDAMWLSISLHMVFHDFWLIPAGWGMHWNDLVLLDTARHGWLL